MNKPTPKQCESLANEAESRAEVLRTSKLMRFTTVSDNEEFLEALAIQQYCCALAEAWAQLCAEANQQVQELQPPG